MTMTEEEEGMKTKKMKMPTVGSESGKKVARREGIQEVEFLGALLNLAGVHERGEGSTPTLGCKAGTHDLPGQSWESEQEAERGEKEKKEKEKKDKKQKQKQQEQERGRFYEFNETKGQPPERMRKKRKGKERDLHRTNCLKGRKEQEDQVSAVPLNPAKEVNVAKCGATTKPRGEKGEEISTHVACLKRQKNKIKKKNKTQSNSKMF